MTSDISKAVSKLCLLKAGAMTQRAVLGAEGPQLHPQHCMDWVWLCTPGQWRQEDQKFSHHWLPYLGQGQLSLRETPSQFFFPFFENKKERDLFNPRYRKYRDSLIQGIKGKGAKEH